VFGIAQLGFIQRLDVLSLLKIETDKSPIDLWTDRHDVECSGRSDKLKMDRNIRKTRRDRHHADRIIPSSA
jgi:hypothetical protein